MSKLCWKERIQEVKNDKQYSSSLPRILQRFLVITKSMIESGLLPWSITPVQTDSSLWCLVW